MTLRIPFVTGILLAAAVLPAAAQPRLADDALRQRERAAEQRRARNDARRGPEFTDTLTRTVRLGRNGSFDLSNVAGDVTITGGGGDDVRIEARKRVRARTEADAKPLLQLIEVQIIERTGRVEVRTELPRRRDVAGAVDYTITLPAATVVTVRTVNGDLRLTDLRGELRADSVSGDIVAGGVAKARALRTVSGDLQLTDAQGDDLVLGTVSGDVTVRGLKARSLELEAVSGDLRFTDVDCERVNLRTISGDIEYVGRLARSGRYDLQTHSGDIRLTPTGNEGFDVDATTFSGDVRSDYQLSGARREDPAGRGPATRTLRGTIGDASALLTLRSFNGDVLILRR